jgi:hypothetical protein
MHDLSISRPAMKSSSDAPKQGISVLAHWANEEALALLAYYRWQARGCPEGSPQEDWFRAIEDLRHTV